VVLGRHTLTAPRCRTPGSNLEKWGMRAKSR
jgi:hypothetical protein